MKQPLDFGLVKNNARTISVVAKNPDGSIIDITGFNIKWQMFARGSKTPLSTKQTSDNSLTIVSGPGGLFSWKILPADTVNLDPTLDYIHEAVTVDLQGNPVTLTNNDPKLSAGRVFLRDQYTVQG